MHPPVPSGYWEATQGHDSAVPMHGVSCLRSNAASTPQPRDSLCHQRRLAALQ
jgi:hypothetical protein